MAIDKKVLVEGAIDYIRKNAIVVTSKKGKEYITLPNYSQAITGNQIGMLSFAYTALRDFDVNAEKQRATQNLNTAVERATPEERAALLKRLMSLEAAAVPAVPVKK